MRTPHLFFAVTWIIWTFAQMVGAYWPNPWLLGGLQLYFFTFEIIGLLWDPPGLDQLSSIVTWSYRKVSKVSERPVTLWSWGGVYVAFIALVCYNVGVFAWQMGVSPFFSVPVLVLLGAFLVGHWLMSWRYG